MCGFLVEIDIDNNLSDRNQFIKNSKILINRGPDHYKYESDEEFFQSGFCRLSIIDSSENGNQPMVSTCGRYICLFNGEIYNHKKIYEKIKNQFFWRGHSDTEILLNAWITYGKEIFSKIDGMYSFVILDKLKKNFFAARDRFGEKPLYYFNSSSKIILSSRPLPINNIINQEKIIINLKAIKFFLNSGYFARNQSCYQNISKLEPGKFMTLEENKISIKTYFDPLSLNIMKKNHKIEYFIDKLDDELNESVRERLISDKPIGLFLSGGIDSSLIAAISKKNKGDIQAFNLSFEEEEYDESKDAKVVADHLNLKINIEKLRPNDLIEVMDECYIKIDEPFFDPAFFPLLRLSKFTKKYVDVVLTGDGGDELFGGYNHYNLIKIIQNKNFNLLLRILVKLSKIINISSHKLELLSNAIKYKNPIKSFAFLRSIQKDFPDLICDFKNEKNLIDIFNLSSNSINKNLDNTEKAMLLDIMYTFNDDYLEKTDLCTMFYSLEARSPFLSKSIFNISQSIPIDYKVTYSQKKIILRKLALKYLPKSLILKKKKGFDVPIKNWLRNELYEWSKEILFDEKNYKNLLLDINKVKEIFNLHKSKKRDCHPYLWATLMLLKFNQHYVRIQKK